VLPTQELIVRLLVALVATSIPDLPVTSPRVTVVSLHRRRDQTLTRASAEGAWAVPGPSGPLPGRQMPTKDDQRQPAAPNETAGQPHIAAADLVGDGRVDLYAGYSASGKEVGCVAVSAPRDVGHREDSGCCQVGDSDLWAGEDAAEELLLLRLQLDEPA
jgi:hypothetical protein